MKKCPRCELNYIADSDILCKVCIREKKGVQKRDEIEPCSICNEAPALPGKDICLSCYKELNGHAPGNVKHTDSADDELRLKPVSSIDEIIPDNDADVDDSDFSDEDEELSLEEIIENEDDDEKDLDDEYD